MKNINMKKMLVTFGSLAATGAFIASAHMGGEMDQNLAARFESESKVLGVSVEEVKNAWADGKNIYELAKEKGIASTTLETNLKASRDAEIKAKMDALVKSGTITQAQADKRIVSVQAEMKNRKDSKQEIKNKKSDIKNIKSKKREDRKENRNRQSLN